MTDFTMDLEQTIEGPDGRAYCTRVRGHRSGNGMWEGWVEFDPQDGMPPLRTDRETEQHGREDLEYWAAGLTATYLEGALARARLPELGSDDSFPPFDGSADRALP